MLSAISKISDNLMKGKAPVSLPNEGTPGLVLYDSVEPSKDSAQSSAGPDTPAFAETPAGSGLLLADEWTKFPAETPQQPEGASPPIPENTPLEQPDQDGEFGTPTSGYKVPESVGGAEEPQTPNECPVPWLFEGPSLQPPEEPQVPEKNTDRRLSLPTVPTPPMPIPIHASPPVHNPSGTKLIIGIDFGTTYTGIAYAFSDSSKVKIVNTWPGASSHRNDMTKIPSIIKYESSASLRPGAAKFDWGNEVAGDDNGAIRGFKLALDPESVGLWTKEAGFSVEDSGIAHSIVDKAGLDHGHIFRSTVDIVTDFIGAVYKHAISHITEAEARSIDMMPKQFAITVPAIWSDMGKHATRVAIEAAHEDIVVGLDDMITEPEAGALYTIRSTIMESSEGILKNGDAFVLCDAGGGTVDLITYQMVSMEPLELQELVSATGGILGSMIINKRFEQYLQQILPGGILAELKADDDAFGQIMQEFNDKIKPEFVSVEQWDSKKIGKMIRLPVVRVKDDPAKNIKANRLLLKGDVLEGIFSPLVTGIANLIRDQMERASQKSGQMPKAIFLVGGFAASPYLNQKLRQLFNFVKVVRPDNGWAAIMKGAVLYKMPRTIRVTWNAAREHLGVIAYVPYDQDKHPPEAAKHKVRAMHEAYDRIPKMIWHISKEEKLQRNQEIRYEFHRNIPCTSTSKDLIFTDVLVSSVATLRPVYPWEGSGVKVKQTLVSNFTSLDRSQWVEKVAADGSQYYSVYYNLVVSVKAAYITFSTECQGIVLSHKDVSKD